MPLIVKDSKQFNLDVIERFGKAVNVNVPEHFSAFQKAQFKKLAEHLHGTLSRPEIQDGHFLTVRLDDEIDGDVLIGLTTLCLSQMMVLEFDSDVETSSIYGSLTVSKSPL
jgi:hypothetical protein